MARKPRSDSVDSMLQAIKDAGAPPLKPPQHVLLRPQDAPFWADLQRTKPRSEWSETDLTLGVHLARVLADIEHQNELLASEEYVFEDRWGKSYPNPRIGLLETLTKRSVSLMRALRIGGADGAASDTLRKNRDLAKKAEQLHAKTASSSDGLLA